MSEQSIYGRAKAYLADFMHIVQSTYEHRQSEGHKGLRVFSPIWGKYERQVMQMGFGMHLDAIRAHLNEALALIDQNPELSHLRVDVEGMTATVDKIAKETHRPKKKRPTG